PIRMTNVGYGVSQILPLLIEPLTSTSDLFSYQQPEVHLHPKAQVAFGDFIFDSFIINKNRFIIETHSDYILNRFRYAMSKSKIDKEIDAKILFFERNSSGTNLISIPINKNGKFEEELPESYINFFIDEELKMLEF
ncbi:MAG: AAA family ATPase, partial [Tannerellaceae bacterium]|nr:AAA family ATPase [Tannerellaceae bacterium]